MEFSAFADFDEHHILLRGRGLRRGTSWDFFWQSSSLARKFLDEAEIWHESSLTGKFLDTEFFRHGTSKYGTNVLRQGSSSTRRSYVKDVVRQSSSSTRSSLTRKFYGKEFSNNGVLRNDSFRRGSPMTKTFTDKVLTKVLLWGSS